MKKLIILSAIALLGFASCKKEVDTPETTIVEYYAKGEGLSISYKDESGFLFLSRQVDGFFEKKFEVKTLERAAISFSLYKDAPTQNVLVQLKVNGVLLNEFKKRHIQGEDDVPYQTFSVNVTPLKIQTPGN